MAVDQPDTIGSQSAPTFPVGGDALEAVAARTTACAPWLWATAIGALGADVVLTVYGLRLGLTELNPIAASLIADIGVLPTLALLKCGAVGVAIGGWIAMPAGYRGLVPAGLALPWVVATAVNLVTIASVVS